MLSIMQTKYPNVKLLMFHLFCIAVLRTRNKNASRPKNSWSMENKNSPLGLLTSFLKSGVSTTPEEILRFSK